MPAVNKQQIVEEIGANITEKYGIDAPVVEDFKTMIMNSLSAYYVYDSDQGKTPRKAQKGGKAAPTAAAKVEAKDKKPRKTSAYNVYVKKMMQSETVKDVPQKEKMAKIAAFWKDLSEADKATYKVEADTLNAANPSLADDSKTEA